MGKPYAPNLVRYPDQWDAFDEYNEDHVAAVVPTSFVKAVKTLLLTRRDMKYLTAEQLQQGMQAELDALHQACIEAWRDI